MPLDPHIGWMVLLTAAYVEQLSSCFLPGWHVSDPALNILICCIPVSFTLFICRYLSSWITGGFCKSAAKNAQGSISAKWNFRFVCFSCNCLCNTATSCERGLRQKKPLLNGTLSHKWKTMWSFFSLLSCLHYQGINILLKSINKMIGAVSGRI